MNIYIAIAASVWVSLTMAVPTLSPSPLHSDDTTLSILGEGEACITINLPKNPSCAPGLHCAPTDDGSITSAYTRSGRCFAAYQPGMLRCGTARHPTCPEKKMTCVVLNEDYAFYGGVCVEASTSNNEEDAV